MKAFVVVFALLATASVFILTPSVAASPSLSDSSYHALGSVDIPNRNPRTPRAQDNKYLFVRGRRIVGRQSLRYAEGKLYLGEYQIRPTVPCESSPVDPSPELEKRLADVPFVRARVAGGVSPRQAVKQYFAAMDSMIARVGKEHTNALTSGHNAESAARRAAKKLDSVLVVTDPKSPQAPRFTEDGLFFQLRGYMQTGVMWPRSGGTPAKPDLDLEGAQAWASMLRGYMDTHEAAMVFLGCSANVMYGGDSAEEVLPELDSLFVDSGVPLRPTGLLSSGMIREIEAAREKAPGGN